MMPSNVEGSESAFWSRSPTPEEDWSGAEGAEANGEWEFEITGHEVGYEGKMVYEVTWPTWQRPDGSNTTYDNNIREADIERYETKQAKARMRAAKATSTVPVNTSRDPLFAATFELDQAIEEKEQHYGKDYALRLVFQDSRSRSPAPQRDTPPRRSTSSAGSTTLAGSRRISLQNTTPQSESGGGSIVHGTSARTPSASGRPSRSHKTAMSAPRLQRARSTQSGSPSVSRSARPASSAASSSTALSTPSMQGRPIKPLPSRAVKADVIDISSDSDSDDNENQQLPEIVIQRSVKSTSTHASTSSGGSTSGRTPATASRPPQFSVPVMPNISGRVAKGKGKARVTPESELREQMDDELERTGAASVVFVDEAGRQAFPTSLPREFCYKEQGYDLGPGVEESDPAFLASCDCGDRRVTCRPRGCDCQEVAEPIKDAAGKARFAYSAKSKLYGLPATQNPIEVVECNQNCTCDVSCPNRVAQLSRTVPIQIFKSKERGWGVRSTKAIPRGKVIGTFSGQLITREAAEKLDAEEKVYCIDLNNKEGADDNEHVNRYTVNAWRVGNWTRFLNHSCGPNLATYSVVWDTIPEENRPHVAFVANTDIPAYTELVFDYSPELAVDDGATKKRKRKLPGQIRCHCGSPKCREWLPGQ